MSSERADALHAALVKQVRSLRSSEEWIEAMAKAAMFHQYSFGNWLLLAAQADSRGTTVTRPAGYRAWQRLGRNVKKGERGYQILAPMIRRTKRDSDDERDGVIVTGFRVVTVFDVSQTDGDALPDVGPRHLEGFDPPDLFDAVVSLLEADGFSFELAELAGPNGTTSPLLRRGVVDSRLGSRPPPHRRGDRVSWPDRGGGRIGRVHRVHCIGLGHLDLLDPLRGRLGGVDRRPDPDTPLHRRDGGAGGSRHPRPARH